MIYLIVFYWIVCGFAIFMHGELPRGLGAFLAILGLCLICGGFIVPAKLVAKHLAK